MKSIKLDTALEKKLLKVGKQEAVYGVITACLDRHPVFSTNSAIFLFICDTPALRWGYDSFQSLLVVPIAQPIELQHGSSEREMRTA
jgi:hypothetical protein